MKKGVRPIDRIRDKLMYGDLYLENTFEQIVIRTMAGSNLFYAKPKGGNEYLIDHTSQVVVEALFEGKEITKEQYLKY